MKANYPQACMKIWFIDTSSITELKKTGREVGRRAQEKLEEEENM